MSTLFVNNNLSATYAVRLSLTRVSDFGNGSSARCLVIRGRGSRSQPYTAHNEPENPSNLLCLQQTVRSDEGFATDRECGHSRPEARSTAKCYAVRRITESSTKLQCAYGTNHLLLRSSVAIDIR